MKNLLAVFGLTLCAAGMAIGSEYYWAADNGAWGQFANPGNWLVGGSGGTTATKLPGAADYFSDKRHMAFDLGGESFEVGGWCATADWGAWNLSLTNGTLRFVGTGTWIGAPTSVSLHHGDITIWDGAALGFGADTIFAPGVNSGASRAVYVKKGGTLDLTGSNLQIYRMDVRTDSGATAVMAPKRISVYNGTQASAFVNSGMMSFTNGLSLAAGTSGSSITITQTSGTMTFGGNISKNGKATTLAIAFNGGTVAATANTAFTVDTATVAANAALTVDVADSVYLDLSPFTFGSGAAITKTGAGTLRLGSLPSALTVSAGAAGFYTASAPLNLSAAAFAPGTRVVFGTEALTLTSAPAGTGISYAVDTTTVPKDVVFLTCADAALLATVKSSIEANLPDGFSIQEIGSSLKLIAETSYIFNSTTVTAWNDPAAWSCGYVPEGKDVFVQGTGVTARVTGAIPACKSITVLAGATLSIETAYDCPPVILTGPCAFRLGGTASVTMTNGLTAVATSASTVPAFAIPTGTTLTVPAGMTFGNVDMAIGGTLTTDGKPGTLTLGYAASGKKTWFGLTAAGAAIAWQGDGGYNANDLRIASPAVGGEVVCTGTLSFTSCTLPMGYWYNLRGIRIGENNPTGDFVNVLFNGTSFRRAAASIVAGGAALTLTNGASFYTEENNNLQYQLTVSQRGQVIVSEGGTLIQYVANGGWNPMSVTPDEPGFPSIVLNGGTAKLFATAGNGKAKFVGNGTFQIYRDSHLNGTTTFLCKPFEGFGSIELPEGGTLTLADVASTSAAGKWVTAAAVPFTGAGSLAVARLSGTDAFAVTLPAATNTATGTASAASGAELFFDAGANWAGTVNADGAVKLTNTVDNAAFQTNAFGGIDLTGDFKLRVGADEASDLLILGATGFLNNGGAVTVNAVGDYALAGPDKFTVAAVLKTAPAIPTCGIRDWRFESAADATDTTRNDIILRTGGGTLINLH